MLIYFFQKIIYIVTIIIANLFLHFQVEGKKNLKLIKKKQYFVIANHRGFLDAFLLCDAIPFLHFLKTNFRYMIKPEWIKVYPIVKLFGGYPLHLKKGDLKKTLSNTEQFIKNGKNILIFPEGTFPKDGKQLKAKQGIGYLAKKYNLPILPMALFGSDGVNGKKGLDFKKVFSKKCFVKIKIGKPFYFNDVADYSDDNLTAAQKIMDRVNAML
ncbi:MAG: lysophospholipid acyltransferase family protein [Patescibacteria group bacterium]|nr:lysophospholipid acyltransferase family protein [Patescibacteria group bacterium]